MVTLIREVRMVWGASKFPCTGSGSWRNGEHLIIVSLLFLVLLWTDAQRGSISSFVVTFDLWAFITVWWGEVFG